MRKDNTWEPDVGRAVREGFMEEVSLELKCFFCHILGLVGS